MKYLTLATVLFATQAHAFKPAQTESPDLISCRVLKATLDGQMQNGNLLSESVIRFDLTRLNGANRLPFTSPEDLSVVHLYRLLGPLRETSTAADASNQVRRFEYADYSEIGCGKDVSTASKFVIQRMSNFEGRFQATLKQSIERTGPGRHSRSVDSIEMECI